MEEAMAFEMKGKMKQAKIKTFQQRLWQKGQQIQQQREYSQLYPANNAPPKSGNRFNQQAFPLASASRELNQNLPESEKNIQAEWQVFRL